MANLTARALRATARLAVAVPGRAMTTPAVAHAVARRGYVSESRQDNANVETAIKLDKQDFADIPPPQMGGPSNATVSPMAEILKQATVMQEGQRPIYLDMQSTTPVDPRVLDAMLPYYVGVYGNPHSRTHAYGWESEKAVDEAREHVAKLIGAGSKEIIFTSGATESNNMSIKGVARFYGQGGKKKHVITSQTEHKCVLDSCRHLQDAGRPRVRLDPIISGGGQERGLRSGTLAPPLVVGFGEACRVAKEEMEYDSKRIKTLSDRLLKGLLAMEHTSQNGDASSFYPGCVNVSFAYVEGESLLMALKDIALSSGSACTSASLEPSYVLRALGNSDESAHSSIRFGIGRFTTEMEIEYVLKAVQERHGSGQGRHRTRWNKKEEANKDHIISSIDLERRQYNQAISLHPVNATQLVYHHLALLSSSITMPETENKSSAPSTISSYVSSAAGAVQSAVGSLTGNTADQNKGEARKEEAKAEYDASQAAIKVPGATVSSSGAVVKDDENRNQGSWNQTVGSAKEAVGGLVGSESLKQTGREQNLEGQKQEAKGQLSDMGSGLANRAQGTVGGAVAGLTGDKKGQEHYEQMRAEGKSLQRGVEHDMQKQVEAHDKVKE
ncbi:hypothetical protein L249_0979 [Ophiocordyceps polyrhachis-furcata BCC 54312]|uniref:Aminotransferase class V domain-containing protein n=1 Tax=Ophiocordyceps polyrhachis-furcata BCC 54312 TaxID=1330021 RepID=A0A367LEI7_9HYPO|nr:hypothetical protein L249_0979 [Ophiocordyceps polyrhachis-furcata BCC 54312]